MLRADVGRAGVPCSFVQSAAGPRTAVKQDTKAPSGNTNDADRQVHMAAAARALRDWIEARDAKGPASAPDVDASHSAVTTAPAPQRESAKHPVAQRPALTPSVAQERQVSPAAVAASAIPDRAEEATTAPMFAAVVTNEPGTVARTWSGLTSLSEIEWSPKIKLLVGATLLVVVVVAIAAGNRSSMQTAPELLAEAASVITPAITGTVMFESSPDSSQIVIAGAEIGTTPVTTELSPGNHVVEFRRGDEVREVVIDVAAGDSLARAVDWDAPRTGSLRVDSTPPGAAVIIQGREHGVTPLTIDDLPAGTHDLLLRGESGSITRRVTVVADSTTEISEGIYSGWVHVSAPFELSISRGNQPLQLDEQNQLMLPPGSHLLTFANEVLGFSEERRVEVTPGGTSQIAIVPSSTMLAVTASEPAEVFVDGVRIGETAIGDYALALGTHQVTVRSLATGEERSLTVTATTELVSLNVDFSSPPVP